MSNIHPLVHSSCDLMVRLVTKMYFRTRHKCYVFCLISYFPFRLKILNPEPARQLPLLNLQPRYGIQRPADPDGRQGNGHETGDETQWKSSELIIIPNKQDILNR